MLCDSVPVYRALKKGLHAADTECQTSKGLTVDLAVDTRNLFVLADTSYGRSPKSFHLSLQVSDRLPAAALTKWLLNM
jgi:hypothetical protein